MSGVRILFFLIGSLVSGSLQAQQWAFELWHTGKVILDTGDTLRGLIKYDLDKDIIQLQANNKLESYTSRKVLLFEISEKFFCLKFLTRQ